MLRGFIPKSDCFMKAGRELSPIAVAHDGAVFAAPVKRENRKKRKSMKLEFLTSLLDTMMASIVKFSSKIQQKHQKELSEVQKLVQDDQDKLKRKLDKLRLTVADLEAKNTQKGDSKATLETEWTTLEQSKKSFQHQIDKFMHDKDQLEKNMLELRALKQAQDLAHKRSVQEFKQKQV
eukprot:CAMPEP_0170451460 /NCGR_PEP_ID=MMETSP0123-20130129/693_1 /TAXON_ID=182087 /ORGANISM="Favella ehrenbergii, Strain Fehren 1" /LENGTH=177 /DNA_ID=CAMNT_0010713157 /DNA_START=38 /DNA_END=571 /DNA_ORIENTATION=+